MGKSNQGFKHHGCSRIHLQDHRVGWTTHSTLPVGPKIPAFHRKSCRGFPQSRTADYSATGGSGHGSPRGISQEYTKGEDKYPPIAKAYNLLIRYNQYLPVIILVALGNEGLAFYRIVTVHDQNNSQVCCYSFQYQGHYTSILWVGVTGPDAAHEEVLGRIPQQVGLQDDGEANSERKGRRLGLPPA